MKKIPDTERIWMERRTKTGDVYYTTTKGNDRSEYYLYKSDGINIVKLGKSKSPAELEKLFIDNH